MCDVFAVNRPQAALRFSLWVSKYRWQSQKSKSNTVVAGLHNSLICDLPSSGKRRRGDLDSSPALAVFWLIWTAGQMFPWAFTTFSLLLSLFCCSCCSLCCLIYFHLAFSSPVPGFSLFFSLSFPVRTGKPLQTNSYGLPIQHTLSLPLSLLGSAGYVNRLGGLQLA